MAGCLRSAVPLALRSKLIESIGRLPGLFEKLPFYTMTGTKHFDLLNAPIEGTNLIEASAGTGKTYTITGLFLRLVLEKRLSVEEILVVTFTEAATEELKERIRGKLREAIEAFATGHSEDNLLNELVKKHKDSKAALRYLKDAVRDFDQAAIFTIHGFCRRVLHENAFESGSLFDTELVIDQEKLKREIVDDFWRKHFSNASHLFIHYTLNSNVCPDGLLSLLGNKVARPYLKVIPQVQMSAGLVSYPDSSLQEEEFRESFNEVLQTWRSAKADIEDILTTDKGLNRNKYRETSIRGWVQSMDDYVESGDNNPVLFTSFKKFTSRELEGAVKKNYSPPAHPFFGFCETLREKQGELDRVFKQRLLGLKVELFRYTRAELARRKAEKNIQSFDDLLLKLHQALYKTGGEKLAKAIRMKFKAALIDEFQDTDPVQYAIFKKAFGDENSILFLIGDPKQAIYSFRNADLFAYMDAATTVESRYTLGENWRSEPGLITAINTMFANANLPFVYDKIQFQPAAPATKKEREVFRIDGESEPPFRLWFCASSTSCPDAQKATGLDKPITKTLGRDLISTAVAAEISRILNLAGNNKVLLGKRALREEEIAVLVRTNAEARLMQQALSALNIPSVLYSTDNIFDSHEAMETERVLAGIVEPNREKLIKAALATDMMGVKGEDLDSLMENDSGWEEWLVKFKAWHDLWDKSGFIRMFRSLLIEEKILTRLISFPDGERRNTNLLHLSEVLHQASTESALGMAGVLKWLSEQRDPSTPRLEEHQLRLESDENAVKLVTIHKSKGLEYPVVFCPFAWGGSRMRNPEDPFTFHDEGDNMRPTLDLGSEEMDENRVLAEREQLAENMRLLYVALTRAKNRCYLVWGRFNEAETSAPVYLFHQPESWQGDVLSAIEKRFIGLSDEEVVADIKTIVSKSGGTVSLSEMPMEAGKAYSPSVDKGVELTCRKFSGQIDRSWRISSFSSLVSGQRHGPEIADRDAISLPARHGSRSGEAGGPDRYDERVLAQSAIEQEPAAIFSFPRGTKAGTLVHDIFEHLDFAQEDTSLTEKLVADKLVEYGFEPRWQEALCDMIQKVLSVPLDPAKKDFTLSRIQNKDRRNELEFYFPLKSISPKELKGLFAKHAGLEHPAGFPVRIEKVDFAPARGFMKGFIDMIFQYKGRFYLVDWKSNFLGARVDDYGQEALAVAMEKELYFLQYHIYALALNRYLHLRLPGYKYETHFGGIYYIFLRGVDPGRGPGFGIYRDRPPVTFINELSRNLIDQAEMVTS
jgi:exodeoxyribonuclease V beta subunit